MLVTSALKKTLEKNIVFKDFKIRTKGYPNIIDVLEFSISCKNRGIMSKGGE